MRKYLQTLPMLVAALAGSIPPAAAQTVSFFEGRRAFPAIANTAFSTADFNGDGVTDAIVASPFSISVYPGSTQGSFGLPISTALEQSCGTTVIAADFNKDGKQDYACTISSGFEVALGNGDGTFQAPMLTGYSGLQSISPADFNGDGIVDLVVLSNNTINVYLGNGDGTFKAPVTTGISNGTFGSITPADINGDGLADLVATRSTTVAVLIGTGTGAFQTPQITPLAVSSVGSAVTGDMNKDGLLDIVVTVNQSSSSFPVTHLAVLLQQTGGTFTPAYYTTQYALQHPAIADVNGDRILDVLASTSTGSPTLTVLLGSTGGVLQTPAAYDVPLKTFKVINLRHLTVPDVVFTDGETLQVLDNNESGVFNPGVQAVGGVTTSPCVQGDFNGDGQPDLACLKSFDINILYGSSSATAPLGHLQVIQLIGPASAIAAGDFNNDGLVDLVATLNDGTIQYLENQGNGNFLQVDARSPAGANFSVLAVGDFNKDGKLDLITGGGNYLAGNGDGSFQPPVSFYPGTFLYFGVADFNSDSIPDVVAIKGGSNPPVILLGLGTGQFTATVLTGVHGSFNPAIGDLNGDGKPDIVIPAGYLGTTVLLNQGNGVFTREPYVVSDFWPPTISATLADLNGDGKLDLVYGILNFSVYAVTGNGNGTFSSTADIIGYGVEDSTSLLTLPLTGNGSVGPSIASGSSVITILEPH